MAFFQEQTEEEDKKNIFFNEKSMQKKSTHHTNSFYRFVVQVLAKILDILALAAQMQRGTVYWISK